MAVIVGMGVDVCSLERFEAASARPGLVDRLLRPSEQAGSLASRAGRFAAKEALAKALGAPPGLVWTDCVVVTDDFGRPGYELSGTVAERAATLGITRVHLSISHDAGIALAMAVCEA